MKLSPNTSTLGLLLAFGLNVAGCSGNAAIDGDGTQNGNTSGNGAAGPAGAGSSQGGGNSVEPGGMAGNTAAGAGSGMPQGGSGNGAAGTPAGTAGAGGDPANHEGSSLAYSIVPLFNDTTVLEPEVHYDRGDAIITRFSDRGRDRHAREDQFQSYDHWLPHYWDHRTANFIFTDYTSKGGNTIDISWVSEWELDVLPEFRAWYLGQGSVAHYTGNYGPQIVKEGLGTYDADHNRIGDGVQFKYTYTIRESFDLNQQQQPLTAGLFMEIEVSQFLSNPPEGRDNYYGTTFLYEVGAGGMVPWYTVGDFYDKATERENSHKLPEFTWLGGRTTLPYQYSDEPDNHYIQMATNLSHINGQTFVLGRRVHHTDMVDGTHDESDENPAFDELAGLAGPNFVHQSCDGCHHRNGRAPVAPNGELLDKWVFKVAAADGSKDPLIGGVLQPNGANGSAGEGKVSIAEWVEADGLRSPIYEFENGTPALFSARIAPSLVGMGLLEAIDEETILAFEDVNDADGNGISGKANISADPVTGAVRLGRFGWKAGASSLLHQIAGALNTDMGVMTSVLPDPDCGSMQENCGEGGAELADEHLTNLVKYVSLLGIRARRDFDNAEALRGEEVFAEIGCNNCHIMEMQTGAHHPLAELRNQTIRPYTDLLLHDMGPGLADNLGEREATGAEWRTTALWGLGLSACVTGGVEGPFQEQVCAPDHNYLHDGRARSIEEAILWHGGEGQASTVAFKALSAADKAALLKFLESL